MGDMIVYRIDGATLCIQLSLPVVSFHKTNLDSVMPASESQPDRCIAI